MQTVDYHVALGNVTDSTKLFYSYHAFRRGSPAVASVNVDSGQHSSPTSLWSGKHEGYSGQNDLAGNGTTAPKKPAIGGYDNVCACPHCLTRRCSGIRTGLTFLRLGAKSCSHNGEVPGLGVPSRLTLSQRQAASSRLLGRPPLRDAGIRL